MKYKILFLICFAFLFENAQGQVKKVKLSTGEWTVQPYADNIVKLTFTPTGYTTNENFTEAVITQPAAVKGMHVEVEEGGITMGNNDELVMKSIFSKDGYRGFQFVLAPDEKIFGGGERALPLNRRGYKFNLYNNPWYGYGEGADNLNYSVPFFTSSKGYGIFFDNASKGYADIGKGYADFFEVGFQSGELNFYVIMGSSYKEILTSYHKLTGTQPLPPRWALGNFMSRFVYTGEVNTKQILNQMKAAKIPVDAIIFDLFWFGDSIKNSLGNLEWVNKTAWPNPVKMINDFKKDNIHTVLIAEPFFLKNTRTYEAVQPYLAVDSNRNPFMLTEFYFGYGGLLDIFKKDAASWVWNNHYKRQLANGVNGWWTDLGEPENHPANVMHNLKDKGYSRLFKAAEVHNVYGHYWNKMLFENYRRDLPKERIFHLNRSGFSGSQRFSIFPWSGDVSRSWGGLKAQLPVMLGMSMSGVPYIHADAGGFAGGEGDGELYVRWLQFAAFTPIFRPHGTALYEKDKNAFSFPSEPALVDEPYRSKAKAAVYLRYNFLPYNYTLAYKQANTGEPLVAPLYYHFPKDTTAINIGNEFMWGENVLVAPVLEKAVTTQNVYLPEGKWYQYFTNELINGNEYTQQTLSLDQIPVFIKAGSFIPLWENKTALNAAAYDGKSITVAYYPSTNPSQGILYDDDGNTNGVEGEIISFKGQQLKNGYKVELTSSQPTKYTGTYKRKINFSVPANQINLFARINGKKQLGKLTKKGTAKFMRFELVYTGKPMTIELQSK
ncbi:MAG: glycoside hydrolase family 31 protein [Ferruginibacter sp.]